ncbi:hypothetical protein VKT23_017369 [Stygiomarasmius scandens]|uniref:F-box domain-containing protein n=1 Tax=Marasmiellus scandens TaxID=2682957 RepID=A0ABR1IWH4_9AGAR
MICSNCGQETLRLHPASLEDRDVSKQLRSLTGASLASDKEKDRISHYVGDAEQDLVSLDEEIRALKDIRQRVYVNLLKYRSLLAPIRRLPPELLSFIFSLVCEGGNIFGMEFGSSASATGWHWNPSPKSLPALTLSSVCHGWRELTFLTQKIWSHVSLDLSDNLPVLTLRGSQSKLWIWGTKKARSTLLLYLGRSSQSPLKIKLTLNSPKDCLTEGSRGIINYLVQQSHRWQAISLHISKRGFLLNKDLQPLFPTVTHLPMLESFEIKCHRDGGLDLGEAPKLFDIIRNVPRLKHLQLSWIDQSLPPSLGFIPWNQLVSLQLDTCRCTEGLRLLSFCSNLVHVTIDFGIYIDSEVLTSSTLPKLESMWIKISFDTEEVIQSICSYLTLPSLASLTLEGSSGYETEDTVVWPIRSLADFFSRSKCTITSLRLKALSMMGEDVLALLALMPLLTELEIHEPSDMVYSTHMVTTALLRGMTLETHFVVEENSQQNDHLVPKLRRLELYAPYPYVFDLEQLIVMVKSRCVIDSAGADRLRWFVFKTRRADPQADAVDVNSSLQKLLLELGMDHLRVEVGGWL